MEDTAMNRKIIKLIFPVLLITAISVINIFTCFAADSKLTFTQQPEDAVVYTEDAVTLSVKATGSNKLSFQWFKNMSNNAVSGIKITGANSMTYTPSTTSLGTYYYYCKVYSTGSTITTITSETASVTVKAPPKITQQPSEASVYTGESADLSVKATGSGTLSYQWYGSTSNSSANAALIPAAVNTTYSAPTTAVGTTYYYCIVTNTDSTITTTQTKSVMSAVVKVTVNARSMTEPTITTQPAAATVYAGTSAKLTVAAAAGGTLSYQWYSNAANSTENAIAISGATDSDYQWPTAATGTVYYYCVVTNTVTSSGEDPVTYQTTSSIVPCTVKAATVITAQPAGVTVNTGDTVKLTVEATGSDKLSYQWYKNTTNSSSGGSKISGATGSSYTVPTTTTGTAYYYCIVTNSDSSITSSVKTSTATSAAAQVTVYVSSASAPDITAQPVSATVYAGTIKKLTVTASGSGTLSYQWYSNSVNSADTGTPITGAINATYSALTLSAGTTFYYCVVTNTAETPSGPETMSATSAIAAITVTPLPVIISQPSDASLFSGDEISLYVSASGSGTLTYQWYKNTSNKANGTKINGATSPTYTVKAGGTGTTYYYCVVTSRDASITEATKTAAVTSRIAQIAVVSADAQAPKIIKQPTKATVMAGEPVTLTVTATASGSLSYQWYSNTKKSTAGAYMISGATSSSYSAPTTEGGKVYYFCQVTNTDGAKPRKQTASVYSSLVLVTVNPAKPDIVKQPASVKLYTGSSYYISVTASGYGKLSYQWYSSAKDDNSSGTAIPGAVNSRFLVPTETAGTTYYYCVVTKTAESASGSLTGAAVSNVSAAEVIPKPCFTLQPAGAVVNSGESVTLSVRASGSGSISYQWYSSTNGTSGKMIKGAKGTDYKLTTKASSATTTTYYYCVITVTDKALTNNKQIVLKSDAAAVTVNAVNAAAPSITAKPNSQTLTTGSNAVLTVAATGSGTLSYQWYSNTKRSVSGATPVIGATSDSFTIPASVAGTKYYFCVVTNTDNTMSGIKTASATSSIAKIIVKNS
jgi:hypothetical protein